MASREHYGIEAPTVVRNLGQAGTALVVASLLLARDFQHFRPSLLTAGIATAVTTAWMTISSLRLKRRVILRLLNERHWRGDEAVLDVGSGRGLVAVEAARRVPHGSVRAIDLWQAVDLSGNGLEVLSANAKVVGVGGG